jgi:EAL domain-containing protein (putative c-di-GMP-specific phosphodiesterase class I)
MFVSIDDLGQTLMPGVSIAADPWLFQRLTRTLDGRVLRQVTHDYAKTERAFSLNLNVATVLSPDFRRFEQTIGLGVRGRLIVEFQHIDVFSDMPAYLFAREYLREVGFKICIDGLNHLTLPFIDREKLGLDLLKMHWSDDLLAGMGPDSITALEQSVRNAGVARIIMCRCESERALKIGHNMGISLFQGRHIDSLLAPAPQ